MSPSRPAASSAIRHYYTPYELVPTFLSNAFTSPWILPRAKKCPPDTFCPQCAHWGPPFRIPIRWQKEDHTLWVWSSFWQRMRDSNPRKRSQSPVCYRYTNPLCDGVIISISSEMSSIDFPFFKKIFPGGYLKGSGAAIPAPLPSAYHLTNRFFTTGRIFRQQALTNISTAAMPRTLSSPVWGFVRSAVQ